MRSTEDLFIIYLESKLDLVIADLKGKHFPLTEPTATPSPPFTISLCIFNYLPSLKHSLSFPIFSLLKILFLNGTSHSSQRDLRNSVLYILYPQRENLGRKVCSSFAITSGSGLHSACSSAMEANKFPRLN